MQQTTGTTDLVCIRPNGERIAVTVAIGHPFHTPEGDWGCPVTISGLHEGIATIYGLDSFQAICLAITFVRNRLASFLADRGRIVLPETGEEFPIDAYFDSLRSRRQG
jgi:uncharacterized protein DUF6968